MARTETVEEQKTTIHKFGKTWKHGVEVSHNYYHNHYNIYVGMEEIDVGFFETGESYVLDKTEINTRDEVQESIEELTQQLFESVAARSEARDLDVSVHIE